MVLPSTIQWSFLQWQKCSVFALSKVVNQTHVILEHLNNDWCDWRTHLSIQFNLNSHCVESHQPWVWPDGEFPWENAPNRSKAGPVAILKEEARNRRVISPKHLWGELTYSVGCSVLMMGSETRDVLPGHVPGEGVRWWSSHEDVRNLGGGWAGFHMFSNMVDLSVFPATT